MKLGDIVKWKSVKGEPVGIVVSDIRHGVNDSFVDVLVNGSVVPVNFRVLKVIGNQYEAEEAMWRAWGDR